MKTEGGKYFPRDLLPRLERWIDRREIYAIKGPRQSGKTTLLKMLQQWLVNEKGVEEGCVVYLTFEDREMLEKFSADAKELVRSFVGKQDRRFYFLIDEFHYLDDGGQKLKLLYDLFENVKFIITGSSSLELTGKTSRFLVGRVFSFYLSQLSFGEFVNVGLPRLSDYYQEKSELVRDFVYEGKQLSLPKSDIFASDFVRHFEDYVLFGGYPEVVKTDDRETKNEILKNIYETYITRDIIELLRMTDIARFRTIVRLLANQIAGLMNYNNLCRDSGAYFKELKRYLSVLEETFVIGLLRPFSSDMATELKKNPKVYFVDTGLRNYILHSFNDLSSRTDAGAIVENSVFSQLRMENRDDYTVNYWRTLAKAEVDFVMVRGKELVPLEVKYSSFASPVVSRSFRSFVTTYQPSRAVVLTKGFWGKLKIGKTHIGFVPVWYM